MVELCNPVKTRDNAYTITVEDIELRTLYTIVYLHLLPFLVLRLYWRSRKAPAYAQRMKERFAVVPTRRSDKKLIWVHAVSVGEVIAATPLVRQLQQQYPNYEFCLTTTTPTGSDRVRAAFGNSVLHYYLPYDLPSLMAIFIAAIKPCLLIIMETELWPNMIAICADKNIPVVLVNGRMSESSAKGYKKLQVLTRPMLRQLSLIAAQSPADAERFVYLGAECDQVKVMGSVKFDVVIEDSVRQRKEQLAVQLHIENRKVVVFASTHPGEDEVILPMIKRLHYRFPDFLAIVVPRHPERFPIVASIADNLHIPFVCLAKSESCSIDMAMVLGDTMGDMLALYGLADVAFVGGSLIAHGGHNFLEAAVWSVPILSGESVFNFQDIAKLLIHEGGLQLVHDHADLENVLQVWLDGRMDLLSVGLAANKVLVANRGALQKLLDSLEEILKRS